MSPTTRPRTTWQLMTRHGITKATTPHGPSRTESKSIGQTRRAMHQNQLASVPCTKCRRRRRLWTQSRPRCGYTLSGQATRWMREHSKFSNPPKSSNILQPLSTIIFYNIGFSVLLVATYRAHGYDLVPWCRCQSITWLSLKVEAPVSAYTFNIYIYIYMYLWRGVYIYIYIYIYILYGRTYPLYVSISWWALCSVGGWWRIQLGWMLDESCI